MLFFFLLLLLFLFYIVLATVFKNNVAKVRYASNQLIHFVVVAFVFEIAISSDVVVVVFGIEDDIFRMWLFTNWQR